MSRYRVLRSGSAAGFPRDERIIEERVLADDEYDRRLYFTAFIAWKSESSAHTLNSIVASATWEFAKANHRKPSTPAQLLPYLKADEKEYYGLAELQPFWNPPWRRDPLPQITERDEIRVH